MDEQTYDIELRNSLLEVFAGVLRVYHFPQGCDQFFRDFPASCPLNFSPVIGGKSAGILNNEGSSIRVGKNDIDAVSIWFWSSRALYVNDAKMICKVPPYHTMLQINHLQSDSEVGPPLLFIVEQWTT